MDATKKGSMRFFRQPVPSTIKSLLLTLLVIVSFRNHAFSQTNLTGKWIDTNHKDKEIEIYVCRNNKIYGKSEKGFIILKDFVYDSKTNAYKGVLVNPDDDEEFKIVIKQPSLTRFTFVIKKFFLTRKFVFEKNGEK